MLPSISSALWENRSAALRIDFSGRLFGFALPLVNFSMALYADSASELSVLSHLSTISESPIES